MVYVSKHDRAKRKFIPLSDERRFRVAYGTWYFQWHEDRNGGALSSSLALPASHTPAIDKFNASAQFDDFNEDLFTRDEAFAEAAKHNAAEWKKWDMKDGVPLQWAVVYEIGKPSSVYIITNLEDFNYGEEDSNVVRPIRLVEPTDEEIAKHCRGKAAIVRKKM